MNDLLVSFFVGKLKPESISSAERDEFNRQRMSYLHHGDDCNLKDDPEESGCF